MDLGLKGKSMPVNGVFRGTGETRDPHCGRAHRVPSRRDLGRL